jgi:hypothetical protein
MSPFLSVAIASTSVALYVFGTLWALSDPP